MAIVFVGALIIGVTLGMLGSGGSALTVPVLVYLVGHGAKESIAESMAIVGLISVAAAIPYARAKQIDWRSVWFFGIPGMIGTFLGAWLGGLASDALQLIVFGSVLFVAAFAMLRKKPLGKAAVVSDRVQGSSDGGGGASRQSSGHGDSENQAEGDDIGPRPPVWKVAGEGTAVGVLTGFVGVGGGFLIVPALVLLGKLSMRLAIGTSLVIIAAKSAVGFAKYEQVLLSVGSSVDFRVIALFVGIGVAGSFVGRYANRLLDQQTLKTVFAGFLVLLGAFVIFREGSKFISGPGGTPQGEHATMVVHESTLNN